MSIQGQTERSEKSAQRGRDFLDNLMKPGEQVTDSSSQDKSAATTLVEMAQELYEFGISSTGESFGIPKRGPKIIALLRGNKSLRGLLAKTYFKRTGRAASQQALTDSLQIIEGYAMETEPQELYMRVAKFNGLWLDIGDQTGKAIHISNNEWTIAEPPILFRRTVLTGQLPEPERDGKLNDLYSWLNVSEEDRPLVVAWLVAALYADIPHPVLLLTGEQGSGKTTAHKILVQILDPSPVLVRKPPRDPETWVTTAAGSWIVGLDNMSTISPWLSDSICRAVTGEGDIRRQLYTDGDLAIFAYRRCVILNGIDIGATRGDLAERMIPIWLESISDVDRKGEDGIQVAWELAHPRILGAILNLAASVASNLSSTSLNSKPRMADYARILATVDQILDTNGLNTYLSKQNTMAVDSLTGDLFITALEALGSFEGTSAELLERLTPEKLPKDWPRNARAVTQLLRRQAPVMRKARWDISDDGGHNNKNCAIWNITPPIKQEIGRNDDSLDSQSRTECLDSDPASYARKEIPHSHRWDQRV